VNVGARGGRIAMGAVGLAEEVRGGIDRYSRLVLRELLPRDDTFCFSASRALRSAYPDSVVPVGGPHYQANDFRGNLTRLVWHQTRLASLLRAHGAGLYYSLAAEGMVAPRVPQVVTLHDTLPLRYPEVYPRLRYYSRHVLPRILAVSAAVIVSSRITRDDVVRFFGIDPGRLHVVYPSHDHELFRPASPEEVARVQAKNRLDRFVLAVGETRPYKNVRRLIEAFARVRENGTKLAIAGSLNRLDTEIVGLPGELGIGERVVFLGHVPDRDLVALYTAARAFAFPSLYEGFGLPPLEAMACGCPVVVSSAGSLPEVCGDAGVYVDPASVDGIAEGIRRVLGDEGYAVRLREEGRRRAATFDPGRTGREIVGVLEGVLERAGRISTMQKNVTS
jgi:glycosyltransferase involved in cell wall biosynthesis